MTTQPGILPGIPSHSRFHEFRLTGAAPSALDRLRSLEVNEDYVIGLGASFAEQAGIRVAELRAFPELSHAGLAVPSTQLDLWLWVRAESPAAAAERSAELVSRLAPDFDPVEVTDGFRYDIGRDLTGYEDGTENPVGDAAVKAGFANESSFVAVQKWLHDMDHFESLSRDEQDNVFGRHRDSNEEFDAPATAHVKRTAQEDFSPEAFLLRRSSPWRDASGCGLMFVGFGCTFYAFEAQMRRMLGLDDEVVDKVFTISKAVSGGYYWCPPLDDSGRLVLTSS